MNEKRPTPDKSAGNRKRAAPTIDLTAKEIPQAAAAAANDPPVRDPATPKQDVPKQEPPKSEPVRRDPPTSDPAVKEPPKSPEPDPKEAPVKESPAPKSALGNPSALRSSAREPNAPPPNNRVPPQPAPERSSMGAVIGGGVAGAAVMSLLLAGVWYAGLLPASDNGAADERVAALEAQIQALQSRPATAGDTQAVGSLTQRMTKVEDVLTKLPSTSAGGDTALNERITATDNALKSIGVALMALNRRYDELAADTRQARSRADAAEKAAADLRSSLQDVSKTASAGASSTDLEPLQQRIAALEQTAKAAQAEIAKATASDKAARLALSAVALRDAVLRGAPFADELAQVKSLGANEQTLAALAPFAASGVPSQKALAQELSGLLPQMRKSTGAPAATGGFLDRLQANAGQLVRVRPVGAPAGDDASAVLARLETDVAKEDIPAALADIAKLPEAERQLAADWVKRAAARQQALAVARAFAADSARSLGSR